MKLSANIERGVFTLKQNIAQTVYYSFRLPFSLFDKKINFLGEGADKIKTTGKTSRCAIIKFKTIIRYYIRISCIL